MERYYFLFAIALVAVIFASVHDLRKREVSNWLNFSLLGTALAYRAIYSSFSGEWEFLMWGVIGGAGCFAFANLFYYTKVFGGGDAKLLIGMGVVLPIESWIDIGVIGGGFLLLLFGAGAIYSLIYSAGIVKRNSGRFKKEFARRLKERGKVIGIFAIVIVCLAGLFGGYVSSYAGGIYILIAGGIILGLNEYVQALDKCMIQKRNPEELTEGDWLERDVRAGNQVVKKTVHGLSMRDIMILRRAGRDVYVREGVPFVPAFLISLILMVCAYFFLLPLYGGFLF